MRTGKTLVSALIAAALLVPSLASADQAQDWVLSGGPGAPGSGTNLNLDLFIGGLQVGLEEHIAVYGGANELTLRGSAIVAVPFAQTQADVEMRIVNLILRTSVGVVDSWQEMVFEPDEATHRKLRRVRAAAGDFERNQRTFYDVGAMMAFPLNNYLLALGEVRYRMDDGMEDRTFDGVVVRDDSLFTTNLTLWGKHKLFGGMGPQFQLLRYEIGGKTVEQYNVGLTYITRAGIVRRNDIIILALTYHDAGWFGGYDNNDGYGIAMLRAPLNFFAAYRTVIDL